jgi:hypothetical protein
MRQMGNPCMNRRNHGLGDPLVSQPQLGKRMMSVKKNFTYRQKRRWHSRFHL